MAEQHRRGLLDTSVLIDLEHLSSDELPAEAAVSAISLAELAAGPHAATTADERGRRQDRLQRIEAVFEPLPFDTEAARAYGRIAAAVTSAGRSSRRRVVDLLIAATASSSQLPLYTRNPDDLRGLEGIVVVVEVSRSPTA